MSKTFSAFRTLIVYQEMQIHRETLLHNRRSLGRKRTCDSRHKHSQASKSVRAEDARETAEEGTLSCFCVDCDNKKLAAKVFEHQMLRF